MEAIEQNTYFLDNILNDICGYLHVPRQDNHVLRTHTKKLDELGEISFPLNIKNWHTAINCKTEDLSTIFDYVSRKNSTSETDLESVINSLKCESENWSLSVNNIRIIKDNVHCYFSRQNAFQKTISDCCNMKQNYGAVEHCRNISLKIFEEENYSPVSSELDLISLRLLTLKKVVQKLTKFKLDSSSDTRNLEIYLTKKRCRENDIVCGDVINDNGKKDSIRSAEELFRFITI